MDPNRFLRTTSLLMLTLSIGLAGCAAPEDSEDEEPSAGSSEEMLNGAGIVPQVSIRGIKIGMTPSKVSRLLGKPDEIERYVGGAPAEYIYGQTAIQFGSSASSDGRVVRIQTRAQGLRTKENVGVGSLRLGVAALPDMNCYSRKTDVDGEVVYRHECAISSADALTLFDFPPTDQPAFGANAKVISVALWKR